MDLNVKAFRLVQAATGEAPDKKVEQKKASSRKGGIIGGEARARAITPARRAEIARTASEARWRKPTPVSPA